MCTQKSISFLTILASMLFSAAASAWDGTGSQDSPYLIKTIADLNQLAEGLNGGTEHYADTYFRLENNLDYTGSTFTPLAFGIEDGNYFSGSFDGNGKTISGINVSMESGRTGLFGTIKGGSVKNLTLSASSFLANGFAGAITGACLGSSIENVRVTSSVQVGVLNENSGTVSRHGGIVGSDSSCTINGALSGASIVNGTEATLTAVGGIVGYSSAESSIKNTFYYGTISNADNNVGAVVGLVEAESNVTLDSNYFYAQTSLTDPHEGVTPLYVATAASSEVSVASATEVSVIRSYGDLNLTNLGVKFDDVNYYLQGTEFSLNFVGTGVLRRFVCEDSNKGCSISGSTLTLGAGNVTVNADKPFGTAMGTADDPFLISDTDHWNAFALWADEGNTFEGKTLKLTRNVEVSVMVGDSDTPFKGSFDGDGNTLTLNYGTSETLLTEKYAAPFRYIRGATIKDLLVAGNIYTSEQFAASVAGYAVGNNTITNCKSTVVITSSVNGDGTHGGLVANVNGGNTTIQDSYFKGSLLGENTHSVGGLVGWVNYESNAKLNLGNVLFNPAEITVRNTAGDNVVGNNTLARTKYASAISITHGYYVEALGSAQGNQVYASCEDGETCRRVTVADGNSYYLKSAALSVTELNSFYRYTGSAIDISPVVTFGGDILEEGTDYSLSYRAVGSEETLNEIVDLGEYTLTVSFMGSCSGDTTINFQVIPRLDGEGTSSDPYIISTSDDWDKFATIVNSGFPTNESYYKLNAVNDNITITTMVGSSNHQFQGIFDGDGDTLTLAYGSEESPLTEAYAAPFRYISLATIKNLRISGNIYTNNKFAASIAASAYSRNRISNCGSTVIIHSNVNGDGTHGGLLSNTDGPQDMYGARTITIENSFFKGSFLGQNTTNNGGLIGWVPDGSVIISLDNVLFSPGSVANNSGFVTLVRIQKYVTLNITKGYYTQSYGTVQGNQIYREENLPENTFAVKITAADNETYCLPKAPSLSGVESYYDYTGSEIAVEENLVVSVDGTPLTKNVDYTLSYELNGATVEGLNAAGEYTLVVTGMGNYVGTVKKEINVVNGLNGEGTAENPYIIASTEDWDNVSIRNAGGDSFSGKFLKLTANIAVSTMIGNSSNHFQGTFDGDGNTLTLAYGTEDTPLGEEYVAPFRYISGATLRNLKVTGTVYSSQKFMSSLVGRASGQNSIIGCGSTADLVSSVNGDGTHGGLVANVANGSTSIENSYFKGKLLGTSTNNVGGLVGWTESKNSATVSLTNCLFNPVEVTMNANGGATLARARNSASLTISSSYYIQAFGTEQGHLVYASIPEGVIYGTVTAADGVQYYMATDVAGLESEYAWTGSAFEIAPVVSFNSTELTKGTDYTVDLRYAGESVGTVTKKGEYQLTLTGAGEYAGSYTTTFLVLWGSGTEADPYLIADAEDWQTFANRVAAGTGTGFYKLANDVTVTTMVGTVSGSDTLKFKGTFDGAGHTLTVSYGSASNPVSSQFAAPFRYVDGATIKYLHTAGTIYTGAKYASGLIGRGIGSVKLFSDWNSVSIVSSVSGDGSHGGYIALLGNISKITSSTVENCLFDGSLLGASSQSSAGFIGYNKAYSSITLKNSLFDPAEVTISGNSSKVFVRGGSAKTAYANDYYTQVFGSATTETDAASDEIIDGSSMTAAELVAALGAFWKVQNGKAVPAMVRIYGAIKVAADLSSATIDGSYSGTDETVIGEDITVQSVVFNRTFTKDKFATIMLPFSISLSDNVTGAEFYGMAQMEYTDGKWTAGATPASGTLQANTPYLVKPKAESISFIGAATLNTTGEKATTMGGDWEFRGTYRKLVIGEEEGLYGKAYGFVAKEVEGFEVGEFAKGGPKAFVPAMRGFLMYNGGSLPKSGSASMVGGSFALPEVIDVKIMDAEGNVTENGTLNTVTGEIHVDKWYDLQGRRLKGQPETKGSYYNNGKMVIVK